MKVVFLLALAVISAASSFDIIGKGTAKGKFDYNGDQCKWYEKRETRSMRSLNIQCGGRNKFSTAYEGDPHKCNWYKDGNQVAYYECLISALKRAKFDENSPSEVSCDKHNCDDVIFSKKSKLVRLIMKATRVEEMIETDEPDWNEFDLIKGFN